jgi:hypothetical protein
VPGLGIAALVAGYAAWYTLYQKVWGNGGSYLYWLTGSGKFSGPVNATPSSSSGGAGAESTGHPAAPGIRNQGGQPAPRS